MSTPSQNFQPQLQNYQSPNSYQSQPQSQLQSQPQNYQSSFQTQSQSQPQNYQSNASSQAPPPSQSNPQGLLTLPQVIALVDSRLTNLEKKEGNDEFNEEMETRFEFMAQEFADLKQIILSLQSYTDRRAHV